jgi:hypothetical protein
MGRDDDTLWYAKMFATDSNTGEDGEMGSTSKG